jgi:hypothetical protein
MVAQDLTKGMVGILFRWDTYRFQRLWFQCLEALKQFLPLGENTLFIIVIRWAVLQPDFFFASQHACQGIPRNAITKRNCHLEKLDEPIFCLRVCVRDS